MISSPDRIEQVFSEALQLASEEERKAYLERACGGDPELRRLVEKLLRAQPKAAGFLEQSLAERLATVDEPVSETVGTVIGPYKLLEQIGEGGFGLVFMAEQQHPIRRKVAVKVLKPGMDSRQVIARFEAERQALALMDHPNIAKVHEAGETASGRPYFVMELVKGIPITDYCDQNQVPVRERLELFIHVCQAVQHAHQKGIIHRDIKPTNVMVTLQDGASLVKVIDFGIAKAMGQQLTDKTLFTNFAQLVGTPLYMSPEQAALSNVDVDTRSDIYSLGVLLYELLTGTTPFDKERFKEAGYDAIRRIIREEEPPEPSTRMSTLGQAATTASANRKSDPKRLSRLFHGELDWIVMKALEKDRNRRYETAGAFAADIERYLHDEAVHACPPSTWYRFRKLSRRYRAALAMTSTLLFVLVAGVVISTWQAIRATQAVAKANKSAAKAEAINKFWIRDLLEQAYPDKNPVGANVTIRELLDRAAERIDQVKSPEARERVLAAGHHVDERIEQDRSLQEEPEVEATIRLTIGNIYRELRLIDKSEPHTRRAMELRRDVLGPEHPDTLSATFDFADVLQLQEKFDLADIYYWQTWEIMERVLGKDYPELLHLQANLSLCLRKQGRLAEAEQVLLPCLESHRRVLTEEHLYTLRALHYLGFLRREQGHLAEAERIMRHGLHIRVRVLGEKHPETLMANDDVAELLVDQGKWAEAERVSRQNLDDFRRALGPEHQYTTWAMSTLAWALLLQGRLSDAHLVFQEQLKTLLDSHGLESDTLAARSHLAALLFAQGQLDEAERLFNEVLKVRPVFRSLETDWGTLIALRCLPLVLEARGKWDEAERFCRQVCKDMRRLRGAEHPDTLLQTFNLAVLLHARGKWTEAEPLFREALDGHRKVYPPEHPWTAVTLYGWANFLLDQGDVKQAEPALREALQIQRNGLVKDHVATGQTLAALGWVLTKTGRAQDGEPLLRESLDICRKVLPKGDWFAADTESLLGGCLTALGQYEKAEPFLLAGYASLQAARGDPPVSDSWPIRCTLPCPGLHAAPGAPPLRVQQALDRIIQLYETWDKPDKAAVWRAKRTAGEKKSGIGSQPPGLRKERGEPDKNLPREKQKRRKLSPES